MLLAVGQILEAAEGLVQGVLAQVVPQGLQLLAEGVAARVLAHDQVGRALADILGLHDLVGFAILQHPVLVDAALVGEGVLADDRLVELHGEAGHRRDEAAGAGDVARVNVGLVGQAVAAHLQGHDDLFQRRVAGPLADAVDGALDLASAAQHAGQAVGHSQAQVVVAVGGEDHRVGVRHVLDHVAEHRFVFGGVGVADRVRQVDGAGAGLDGGLDAAAQEVAVRTGGVLGRPFHVADQVAGVGDGLGDGVQHLFLAHPQDVIHVVRAGRDEGVDTAPLGVAHGLGAAVDVDGGGAGQAAYGAFGDDLGDALNGFEVAVRGDREAGLDDVDPHLLEDLGQLQLFVQRHGGAGRLLPVAHGGVEDDDAVALGSGGLLGGHGLVSRSPVLAGRDCLIP